MHTRTQTHTKHTQNTACTSLFLLFRSCVNSKLISLETTHHMRSLQLLVCEMCSVCVPYVRQASAQADARYRIVCNASVWLLCVSYSFLRCCSFTVLERKQLNIVWSDVQHRKCNYSVRKQTNTKRNETKSKKRICVFANLFIRKIGFVLVCHSLHTSCDRLHHRCCP